MSWALSKTEEIAPFWPLISPKAQYCWTDEMEEAFIQAKKQIVERVKNGIATFDTNKVTVLNMDWLQVSISMAILQKHCNCLGVDIRCCPEGWKLMLFG